MYTLAGSFSLMIMRAFLRAIFLFSPADLRSSEMVKRSSKKLMVLLNENISGSVEKIEVYLGSVISFAWISRWLDRASSYLVPKFLMKSPIYG